MLFILIVVAFVFRFLIIVVITLSYFGLATNSCSFPRLARIGSEILFASFTSFVRGRYVSVDLFSFDLAMSGVALPWSRSRGR